MFYSRDIFDSLAESTPSTPFIFSTHSPIVATSLSTSSKLFPACKQTLTRCPPSGTVGGTIALTTNPAS